MGEADETETPDDSDTTEGEPKEEEVTEESEDNSEDNSEETTDPEDSEVPDEEQDNQETPEVPGVPEEQPVADADEESGEVTVNGSSINSVTPTAVTIAVKQYEKDGTPATGEGGAATDRELTGSEKAAEVTFIDGTSADDSKALGGERPVKFLLDMEDGWKADGLAVKYTIAKGGDVTEDKKDRKSVV